MPESLMKMVAAMLAAVVLAAAGTAQDDPYAEDVAAAERALSRGEIAKSRSIFDDVLADWEDLKGTRDAPGDVVVLRCRRGLMAIDLRGGRYGEVVEVFDGLDERARSDRVLRSMLADALTRSGEYERAEAVLRGLRADDDPDGAAGCRLGELLIETGRRDEGTAELERVVDESRSRSVRSADELSWIARAHIALGGRRHVEQAAVLLVEAMRLDPDHAMARTLRGRLQFEVYGEWAGADSGEKLLLDVLQRNGEFEDALVWLYRIRSTNHLLEPAKTEGFLDRALAANPSSVTALIERGVGFVDDRRFEEGAQVLDRALAVNPRDRRALAQRSAVALLRGEAERALEFRQLAEERDPAWPGVDLAVGDRMVALYRFGDAIPHYEAALAKDDADVEVLHGLAKALVYTGRGERAREVLARAKELQPGYVNPWRNNMIAVQELLEEEYERVEDGGFLFLLHRDDRAVLERYLVPFQLEARRVLGEKYGYMPETPVRVEVFRRWDDFSVRTIGFRGFTALGACFGPMITMVSPVDGDLRQNDFMWTATVWHEYTHVLTLALSDHRVPRWLTEGLSVYEEGQKDRSWERGMDRELVDAYHNGEIPPVRLLNRLFRGPRILFGYYQGGLIVDRLAQEFGFPKVVEMLRAYAKDLSTEEVFEDVFGIDSRTFDQSFLRWVREERLARLKLRPRWGDAMIDRFSATAARDPDDVDSQLRLAWAMLQRGSEIDAGHHLRQVLRVDPANAEAQLVYAELLRRRGQPEEAVESYRKGFAGGADDFDSRMGFARLLLEREEIDEAIRQLQSAKACWPTCTEQASSPELLLARIYRDEGRRDEAMMELKTFCARTARAFQPRLELAEFAREAGDRREEIELLEEAVSIDPFSRSVHLRLADAYLAVDRRLDAVRELEVALAVLPGLDRDHLGTDPTSLPRIDSPDFLEEQAAICVRLGKILRQLEREDGARAYLERAIATAPNGDASAEARRLLDGR